MPAALLPPDNHRSRPAGGRRKLRLTTVPRKNVRDFPFFIPYTRKGRILAAAVTLAVFLIGGGGMIVWKIIEPSRVENTVVAYIPGTQEGNGPLRESLNTSFDYAPKSDFSEPTYIPPPEAGIIASSIAAPISFLPSDSLELADLTTGLSLPAGAGRGGSQGGGELGGRCTQENRLKRLKETGGIPQCDEGVLKGLRWLAARQNSDGSWGASRKGAMTGLALLAYLARCETPYSEEFGETCQKGLVFLINLGGRNNGVLSETPGDKTLPYEHAIAAYALAEAQTLCTALHITLPGLAQAAQKAGEFITAHQGYGGSWYYWYREAPGRETYMDLSLSGWNLQAVKAMDRTGLPVAGVRESLLKALPFFKNMSNPATGQFAYTGQDYRPSMTGVGVLGLQLIGAGSSDEALLGLKWIEANRKNLDYSSAQWDLYMNYYCAQAMINRGGPAWRSYGRELGTALLRNQREDGSWPPPANKNVPGNLITADNENGRIYRNSLAILCLAVFYRYQLPVDAK